MDFGAYQTKASETAKYPNNKAIEYLSLGLASEAGEVAGKVKKVIRDFDDTLGEDQKFAIMLEVGDVLWYVAQISTELGFDLSDVAAANIEKLAKRKAENKISGEGDYR
jgi:NTP pyrophosphatase (non-canonical NTP hydrolase)